MVEESNTPGTIKMIKEFFELLPGQKMTGFAMEYRALTTEDKVQLAEGISNGTLTY